MASNAWTILQDGGKDKIYSDNTTLNSAVWILRCFGVWGCVVSVAIYFTSLSFRSSPGKREEAKDGIIFKLILAFIIACAITILDAFKTIFDGAVGYSAN